MRCRAVLEYDGTDFSGWQRQADARTVQGEIETAIRAVTGEATKVVGAGRTDAGVHALGQVAHFDTVWRKDAAELHRALNAHLAWDVALRALDEAPPGFHARYSAVGRHYRYDIYCGPIRSPLRHRRTLHVPWPLDTGPMMRAAGMLVGTRDFAGFGQPTSAGGSTVRRLDEVLVHETEFGVSVDVEGNAFLRHQVRRMAGLLVDIGRGALPVEAVEAVLRNGREAPATRRLAPQGLTLTAIRYPSDEEITNDPSSWGMRMGE